MKRYFLLFLLLQLTVVSVWSKPVKTAANSNYVTILFSLSKQETISFQYYDSLFNFHTLVFDNESSKDSVITKKIYSAHPISWSYGILNDDLKGDWKIMYYVFLAQPGDSLYLSYKNKPFLNTSRCKPNNIIAEKPVSYYSNVKPHAAKPGNQSKNDAWLSFLQYFNEKYEEELKEISADVISRGLNETNDENRRLICRIHYYKKLFDWLWQGDGTFFPPAATLLGSRLTEIKDIINDKNLFITNELLDVIDGYVRLKLIKQNKDFSNGINIYNAAANEDLGKYKSGYLNVCLKKSPVKTGAAYSAILQDYRQRYVNTAYIGALDSLAHNALKYFPLNNKLLSSNGVIIDFKKVIDEPARYTFIDFWASWCLPCRQQLPLLHKIKQKLGKYPIKFISVNLDEKPEAWKEASKKDALYLTENNFYLLPHLKKELVSKLKMNLIPRYIVLKGSQILAADFYQPVEPAFEKELIMLLNFNH
ncbi:redoxin family protein [Mucilaginibacter sp. 21P]|uniref:TlpA family protein disulfide reductase n=1 Tax=Mucilaginibacter sp. 21P TaxID=2778902 RepID=UPI001C5986E5|nr:TlpA disulfide reductase family protein [Mucilaginibacter sp. 21P]QXV65616.1 redoxin family protein [Mucilaginibacter sp. 21P]